MTFRNESTGEYQFYYVQFKATAPGIISVIDLSTPVRQSSSHVITVFNPLTTAVSFNINCNIQDVNLPPQFTVPAQSEVRKLLFPLRVVIKILCNCFMFFTTYRAIFDVVTK